MKRMNKKIILICNSENPFLFNRCYYDQVDEVAMGSPLGTVVAKGFDEKKRWLTEYELFPLLVNIMLFPSRSTFGLFTHTKSTNYCQSEGCTD